MHGQPENIMPKAPF